MEEKEEKPLIVLYTINTKSDKDKSWDYGKGLPKGWWWVGGGSTAGKQGYLQEEQFTGPSKARGAARMFLTMFFKNLQRDGIITKFKVRESYKEKTRKLMIGRKSPAESAVLFPEGTVKRGQNGTSWSVTKTAKGISRWVRVTGSSRVTRSSRKTMKNRV
jgi:hypothetical protein